MRKLSTNASVYAVIACAALTLFAVTGHAQESPQAGDPDKYLLLSTSHTGTMEEELNAAGARGYRVAGAQGRETAAVSIAGWCPDGDEALVSFELENGKTVSICRSADSSELKYFYGTLGKDPELEYRGPLLGTIEGVSGYSHDLAGLGRDEFTGPFVSTDVSPERVAAAAKASDSGGFFHVYSVGCCGGEEESYLFRRGAWEYAVRVGYSRNVNPDIAVELGDYSDWELITMLSPDGEEYIIR